MSYQQLLELSKKEAFVWSFPNLTEKQKEEIKRQLEEKERAEFLANFSKK